MLLWRVCVGVCGLVVLGFFFVCVGFMFFAGFLDVCLVVFLVVV